MSLLLASGKRLNKDLMGKCLINYRFHIYLLLYILSQYPQRTYYRIYSFRNKCKNYQEGHTSTLFPDALKGISMKKALSFQQMELKMTKYQYIKNNEPNPLLKIIQNRSETLV